METMFKKHKKSTELWKNSPEVYRRPQNWNQKVPKRYWRQENFL